MYKKTRAEGFGPEVKRRIMIGTYVLSHGYYDAYYLQAQKLRRMIADDFQACFRACDVIAGPVAPTVAWKIGAKSDDPVANYLADIFTLPASLAGLPGMSLPAGFGEGEMPVGLQLIGNYFDEGRLLHAAHLLRLQVVGVVVAVAQHVGADHDAALHLVAEAFGACAFVHLRECTLLARGVDEVLGAMTVAHAVKAAQVAAGFGRRDDVIHRD